MEEICTRDNWGPSWIRITAHWGEYTKAIPPSELKKKEYRYKVTEFRSNKVVIQSCTREELVTWLKERGLKGKMIDAYVKYGWIVLRRYKITRVK